MRWNGYRTKLCLLVAVAGITSGFICLPVKAAKKDAVDYALSKIEYTNDGGVTTLHNEQDGDLIIQMDTSSLEQGYYTSFFYTDGKQALEQDQVIAIKLHTKSALAMNLNLLDQKGKSFACKNGQVVYLKENGSTVYQMAVVENGSFTVTSGFAGTIYIPVSLAVTKEEAGTIKQLAFVLTQKENEETYVTLNSMQVLSGARKESQFVNAGYQVVGEKKVTIPAVGEYQYVYRFYKNGQAASENAYTVSLKEDAEGVTLRNDGVLQVTEHAKEQGVSLIYTVVDGQQVMFGLQTVDSWLKKQEDGGASAYSLPSVKEMGSYRDVYEEEKRFAWIEDVLRMLLVAAAVGYLIFYQKRIKEN